MARRNTFKAREERAAELAGNIGVGVEAGTPTEPDPAAKFPPPPQETPQGNAIQFNIDQLFAAFGAKEFECTMLRAEVQKLQQIVQTYKNLLEKRENS